MNRNHLSIARKIHVSETTKQFLDQVGGFPMAENGAGKIKA